MNIAELIALAVVRSGKQAKELAAEMGNHPSRLSKIKTGIAEASASEIIFLAQQANEKPLEVLAEIEAQNHPQFAQHWRSALKESGIKSLK